MKLHTVETSVQPAEPGDRYANVSEALAGAECSGHLWFAELEEQVAGAELFDTVDIYRHRHCLLILVVAYWLAS